MPRTIARSASRPSFSPPLVDTLARTMARIEVPRGVLTAFIGTPFFIWLLATARRSWQ